MSAPAWELGQAYASDDEVRAEAATLPGRCHALAAEAATLLARDAASFVAALGALRQDVEHLRDYGRMRQYADAEGSRAVVGVALGAALEASAALDRALDVWAALPSERADAALALPSLAEARHVLSRARALAPHRLSPTEERVWAARDDSGRGRWESLHEQVEASVRVVFDTGTGERPVGLGQLGAACRHPDHALRRSAYTALAAAYGGIADLVASCWDAAVTDRLAENGLRDRVHPAQATLDEEELPLAGLESLVAATTDGLGLRHRLLDVQADLLGVDTLVGADVDAEPSGLPAIGWEDAWAASVAGLRALHGPLGEEAEALLAAGRVDLQSRAGKQAYAVTFQTRLDPPAYLSASFGGRVSNVTTIGHELGHAVALGAARRARAPIARGWPGVVFEVPSLLGELATGDVLTATARPEHRPGIAVATLQDICWSVFEATAFCRVELALYADRAGGRSLTAERILGALREGWRTLLGPRVTVSEEDALVAMASWAGYGVSYRFYNFQYAVGALTALALLGRRTADPERFAAELPPFLAGGRVASPTALLAPFGLELGSRALWDEGLVELGRRIESVTL
ncbi:MAG: hypothetical protein EXQ77_00440 [Thermoleophilia bacterium]|nr:hypothetical protein [Thermoleophilia bacterium]